MLAALPRYLVLIHHIHFLDPLSLSQCCSSQSALAYCVDVRKVEYVLEVAWSSPLYSGKRIGSEARFLHFGYGTYDSIGARRHNIHVFSELFSIPFLFLVLPPILQQYD
jgi:hypothetical protein